MLADDADAKYKSMAFTSSVDQNNVPFWTAGYSHQWASRVTASTGPSSYVPLRLLSIYAGTDPRLHELVPDDAVIPRYLRQPLVWWHETGLS
jgi:hypothetical protein